MRLSSGLAADAGDGDRGGAADQGTLTADAGGAPVGRRTAPARRPGRGGADGRGPLRRRRSARSIEANRAELGARRRAPARRGAEVTDWRKQLRKHRKEVLIGAAVAGFVLGGGIAGVFGLFSGR